MTEIPMIKTSTYYDLEQRTLDFAKDIIRFCKQLPNNIVNMKLIDQLIRSAGSIGANYCEANEALSKKDFLMRMRISRKEAKETIFWLELVLEANPNCKNEAQVLITEALELKKILSAIITKSEKK